MNAIELQVSYSKSLGDLFPSIMMPAAWKALMIKQITSDSRTVRPGALFFAQGGTMTHGERFIDDAIHQGAIAVIVEAAIDAPIVASLKRTHPNLAVFSDECLSQHISEIAGRFFNKPSSSLSLIGVTGTNGKSSCVHLISELWCLLGRRSGHVGTLGYGIKSSGCNDAITETGMTTPSAIRVQEILAELHENEVTHVAMEVSSHGIHQSRVVSLDFDIAILTNVTRDHLDYHKTFEEYARVKNSFVCHYGAKTSIVNIDDENGLQLSKNWSGDSMLLSYSLENSSADLYVAERDFNAGGVTARITSPWGTGILRTSLLGSFNLSNILACIAACCVQGEGFQKVLKHLSEILAPNGRMQKVSMLTNHQNSKHAANDIVGFEGTKKVYIDFAHTPDALEKAIIALRQHCEKNIWLVFGCGGDRDAGKRPLMGEVAAQLADRIVVTSDNPRSENPKEIIQQVAIGAQTILQDEAKSFSKLDTKVDLDAPLFLIEDREDAIAFAIKHSQKSDIVLIAGKGHENYQLVGEESHPFSDNDIAVRYLKQFAENDGGLNDDLN